MFRVASRAKSRDKKKHMSGDEGSGNKKSNSVVVEGISSSSSGTNEMAPSKEPPRLVGTLEPYVIGENFEHYLERIKMLYAINYIEDDMYKTQLLLLYLGPEASSKVITSFKPVDYTTKKFKDVVEVCKKLFMPEVNVRGERFRFYSRCQHDGESFVDYSVALQTLVEHCKFEAQDNLLADRFIMGIRNTAIKKRLIEMEETATFNDVVQRAKSLQMFSMEAEKMKVGDDSHSNVNRLRNENPKRSRSQSRGRPKSKDQPQMEKRRSPSRDGKDVKCFRCHQNGHYARDCYSKKKKFVRNGDYNKTENHSVELNEQLGSLNLGNCNSISNDSHAVLDNQKSMQSEYVNLTVDERLMRLECDTGSCVSVISFDDYKKLFPNKTLLKTEMRLSVVSGELLRVMGKIDVKVVARKKLFSLSLHVIKSDKKLIPLLGRDWMDQICPEWRNTFAIHLVQFEEANKFRECAIKTIKSKYSKLFDNDMTQPIKNFTVEIRMKENAKPFVHKAYTVPFNVRARVSDELDKMEREGIIEKVEYSDWASPVVVVVKKNKDLRICMDGSVTINPHIESNHYPLPLIDELVGGKPGMSQWALIDLKGAYTQLMLGNLTKRLLAINTLKGLYAYKRLPFGVKPAAQIFQSVMDKILEGLDGVQAYIDDILIWARNAEELYERIVKVLNRLTEYNVKVNLEKCEWFVSKVVYLGHELSVEGISPNKAKVMAIKDLPQPKNVTQLKSFLGMVMFYAKFMQNLGVKCAPLFRLLKKEAEWQWTDECEDVWERCKTEICSDKLLVHYDPSKPIIITCDASNDGIGGVMSHLINGVERPVFFVSRTLTRAEKNYPILHREALAIVFAMEKFYKYVYGHHVEIFTDHKPLEGVFGNKKGEPPIIATRLQRYIMRLSIFDYTLHYKKGSEIGHADCLSRLPLNNASSDDDLGEEQCFEINAIASGGALTLNVEMIARETAKDPILSQVSDQIMNGWKNDKLARNLRAFYAMKESLNVERGCVMYGSRVIVPESLKIGVLKILHTNHLGMVRMKQVAREYVFWQGINNDIESYVKECEPCQVLRKDKPDKEYGKWAETHFPFERIHIDFFHFKGKTFLILVDAYSRWLEIRLMSRTDAAKVILELESIFSVFGYPVKLVCDNGPPFSSYEFKKFCESHNITLTHSPPYHPQSNGIVERAVQTTKSVLKKFVLENSSFQITKLIEKFLHHYRNQPRTEEGIIPAHRMFSYKPRWGISDLVIKKNELSKKVSFANNEKTNFVKANRIELKVEPKLEFKVGESVLYLSQLNGATFSHKAKVIKKESNFVYVVSLQGGNTRKAHINQLRKSILKTHVYPKVIIENSPQTEIVSDQEIKSEKSGSSTPSSDDEFASFLDEFSSFVKSETSSSEDEIIETPRRPQRDRQKPVMYDQAKGGFYRK